MKKIFFALLLIPLMSKSQKIGNGLMNIYKSVGMVSYLPPTGGRSLGTGSLIFRDNHNGTLSVFLITCKHVLPPNKAQSSFIYFDIANESSPSGFSTIKIDIFDSVGKYFDHVKLDPDSNDVAVINVNYFFAQEKFKTILQRIIPYEMLATRDSIKPYEINVGDDVYFIGVPGALYDKRNISPILRGGIISTPPEEDFYFNDMIKAATLAKYSERLPDKLSGFLIDATAIPGSSGSLVFLKPKFIRINNGIMEYNKEGGEPLILGILAFSYLDLGPTVDPIRINIGGVISASAIQKTINLFPR